MPYEVLGVFCCTLYYYSFAVNTLNQISHLNQMAMQAQHQRIVDPRLQGIRGMYTPPVSGGGPRGMGSSAMMNRTLTPVKQGIEPRHVI